MSLRASAPRVQPVREPIAIVGMACRFPGADNPDELRDLLRGGVDAVDVVPPDRWDVDELYDPEPGKPGKMVTRWMGALEGIDQFDPQFFGIAPREANSMDPQQRLLLEVSWEAMERAAIPPAALRGSNTGVFVGLCYWDYCQWLTALPQRFQYSDAYAGTGNAHSVAANRLSYLFDFHGPSFAVDTACSSSLLAIHLARESLLRGESDVALAGGANAILVPDTTIVFSAARMMSPEGRSKSFDASADGYVRGEGCGIVVLKRYSDAKADGDHIHALLLASGANQDGRTSGITAPNGAAQRDLMRAVLTEAERSPSQLGYMEAHGTGTPLGDPIELEAIAEVIGERPAASRSCRIGSVKANFGHLEAASGVAGVMKAVLALEHGEIYPQVHFKQLNPLARVADSAIEIPTGLEPWEQPTGTPRLAGVNSFGFGGANAHVVLEEAPPPAAPPATGRATGDVLTLSARDADALRELAGRLAPVCRAASEAELGDICLTAATGRDRFKARLAVEGRSGAEVAAALDAYAAGDAHVSVVTGTSPPERPRVAFLFTGQGSQYAQMGRELYADEPVFRERFDRCAATLDELLDVPLRKLVYPDHDDDARLDQTRYTQPALFALEYALAELWRSWGIEPDLVAGHSIGEYVAACRAGALDLEDALRLVAERARLMGDLPAGGCMAAVLSEREALDRALELSGGRVSLAAINGPGMFTISGDRAALGDAATELREQGATVHELAVSHAFHSRLMEPMLPAFERIAGDIEYKPPSIPLASNVHGRLFGPGERPDAEYWTRHIRQPVDFAGCVSALGAAGAGVMVEVGPNPTLIGLGRRGLRDPSVVWAASLKQGIGDRSALLRALGSLFVAGVEPDWSVVPGNGRRRVPLPTYPFQRSRYWVEPRPEAELWSGAGEAVGHPLLGSRLPLAEPTFEGDVGLTQVEYMREHVLHGAVVFPGVGFLELSMAAARATNPGSRPVLRDVRLLRPLVLREGEHTIVNAVASAERQGERELRVYSRADDGGWQPHVELHFARGRLHDDRTLDIERLQSESTESFGGAEFYAVMALGGYQLGPRFQSMTRVWRRDGEALVELRLPEELVADAGDYNVHPVLLDGCFQSVAPAVRSLADMQARATRRDLTIPVGVGRLELFAPGTTRLWAHSRLRSDATGLAEGDVDVYDSEGGLVARFERVQVKRLEGKKRGSLADDGLYEVEWEPADSLTPSAPEGRWLILGAGELPERIASALAAAGAEVIAAPSAETPMASETNLSGVVLVAAADAPAVDIPATVESELARLLEVAKLPALEGAGPIRLAIVTRGRLVGGPLAAMAMSLAHEQPNAHTVVLDLDADGVEEDVEQIVAELAAGNEPMVAYRGGVRQVARLTRIQAQQSVASGEPASRRAPGSGEVEIAVEATAAESTGLVGVVAAVGAGVDEFRVGDAIVAAGPTTQGSFATIRHELVAPRPRGLDVGQAATLPTAYVLARYALADLARLQPGERCLIIGAGALAAAARRVALEDGAECVDETGGLADVVLQCPTPGEPVPAPDVAPFARLVDVRDGRRVDSGGLPRAGRDGNVAFFSIDSEQLYRDRPDLVGAHLRAVCAQLGEGDLEAPPSTAGRRHTLVRPDAGYLITGGLGALGLTVARWLAGRGAGTLVLAGRRPPSPDAEVQIAALRTQGVSVEIVHGDVADPGDVARMVRAAGAAPLRGVVHAAGVLDDRFMRHMDSDGLARVLAPKVAGSWNLHVATEGHELDFFVLFSSASGVLGSPGQANYAAANAFLDALAHLRRRAGLPALSIDWGPWAAIGMAARSDAANGALVDAAGLIPPDQALAAFERLLAQSRAQVAVLATDWGSWRTLFPNVARSPLLSKVMPPESAPAANASAPSLALGEMPADELPAAIEEFLVMQTAGILDVAPDSLDVDQPLDAVGLDSLMALELKNRVELTVGVELPIVALVDGPSITKVGALIRGLLAGGVEEREVTTVGGGD